MTWKNRNWHGTDASNEVSLFEYGFIMRWRPKRQDFQVVHLHGFDKEGRGLYMFGYFDYAEELQDLKDERLKEICRMCGMTEEPQEAWPGLVLLMLYRYLRSGVAVAIY